MRTQRFTYKHWNWKDHVTDAHRFWWVVTLENLMERGYKNIWIGEVLHRLTVTIPCLPAIIAIDSVCRRPSGTFLFSSNYSRNYSIKEYLADKQNSKRDVRTSVTSQREQKANWMPIRRAHRAVPIKKSVAVFPHEEGRWHVLGVIVMTMKWW